MADKKLNSVSPVTDAAYVYAETSNGETVKISKADLATVVAVRMFPGMTSSSSGFKSGTLNLVNGVDNSIRLGAGILFTYTSGAQSFRAFGINYWGSAITTIYADTSSQGFSISKNASSPTIVFTPDRDRTLRYVFIGELFE